MLVLNSKFFPRPPLVRLSCVIERQKRKNTHISFFNLNGVKRIYMVSDNHDNAPPPRVALTGLASLKVSTKHFQENVELVSEGRIVLPRQEG